MTELKKQIIDLLSAGLSNHQISKQLGCSIDYVRDVKAQAVYNLDSPIDEEKKSFSPEYREKFKKEWDSIRKEIRRCCHYE